ncbi:MAG: helix-turn-helix transcriptional regulator [Hyphomonadaceae bacterium]|nr:helix-turn-helix transcriptional regulator [Hyphomonadaceae bacterium]
MLRLDTAAARPHERFDYWRAQFTGVDMAALGEAPYEAVATLCQGDDGVLFTDIRCDPTAARYVDELDHMRLSLVTEGGVEISHGRDQRHLITADAGLNLLDCKQPSRADSSTGYSAHLIALPRALVHQVMGGDPIGYEGAIRTLPETAIGLMLKAQMRALAKHGPAMSAEEAHAAMAALSALALGYLQSVSAAAGDAGAEDKRFRTACALIAMTKESPGFNAVALAGMLGCSRASLYRLFDRRGLSVSAYIRDTRLNHGRTLLRERRLDVGEVALRCGYGDASAFGKAFRRRFGMSPREWREEILRN